MAVPVANPIWVRSPRPAIAGALALDPEAQKPGDRFTPENFWQSLRAIGVIWRICLGAPAGKAVSRTELWCVWALEMAAPRTDRPHEEARQR